MSLSDVQFDVSKTASSEAEPVGIPLSKSSIVRKSSCETNLSETFSVEADSAVSSAESAPSDTQALEEDPSSDKPISVQIPDMFSSIMAIDPPLNPHYEKVKLEADAWAASVFRWDELMAKKHVKADFAYMNAIWAPTADAEAYRMMVDWHTWVFMFDDQFDEGPLASDPAKTQEEIDATLGIMVKDHPEIDSKIHPIRHVFQTTWIRLCEVVHVADTQLSGLHNVVNRTATSELLQLQERWIRSHEDYFSGIIRQVKNTHAQVAPSLTVDEYMSVRRESIGAAPSCSLVEYACGIQISQSILDNPSVTECIIISADLVILVNDILSYRKDLEQGVEHNLIRLLKGHGKTDQEAVDYIGEMLDECYRRWYRALAEMPIWGEDVDREVLKFIDGCRNIALGNLYWSFKSGRYLRDEGAQVRASRILNLPKSTPTS